MLGEALCIKNYDFGVGIGIARRKLTKMNVGQRCINEATTEHLENSFLSTLKILMISIKNDAIAAIEKIKLTERGD
jgi:hypothetical protein